MRVNTQYVLKAINGINWTDSISYLVDDSWDKSDLLYQAAVDLDISENDVVLEPLTELINLID